VSILEDTEAYESWLGTQCKVVEKDLARNHASWPLSTDFATKSATSCLTRSFISEAGRSRPARRAAAWV